MGLYGQWYLWNHFTNLRLMFTFYTPWKYQKICTVRDNRNNFRDNVMIIYDNIDNFMPDIC